jgi:DNA phosphorothioation-associated DGQHR protein 1
MNPHIKVFALKISQPLGDFFTTKIKASDLLNISFSEELQYIDDEGKLKGSQRKSDDKRLKDIAKYIDSVEMSFPNTIILAANYTEEGEVLENDDPDRWALNHIEGDLYQIEIPLNRKLAAIIDGQHRVKAFNYIEKKERLDIEIPCSIFFDLPNSYQAFLFATVNGNQKRVDRSLALEQFGFNVDDEPRKSWTPEKLAVFYSRKLNIKDTPFHFHIRLAPRDDNFLLSGRIKSDWLVSTATIVDGILLLISKNPKRDRVEMQQEQLFKTRSRKLLSTIKDDSPLRQLYLKGEDESDERIYECVNIFFTELQELVWARHTVDSYILKTIGILASFDFLKQVLLKTNDISRATFRAHIQPFQNVNFADQFFQQASGIGRSRIRNLMLVANGWADNIRIRPEDLQQINNLLAAV